MRLGFERSGLTAAAATAVVTSPCRGVESFGDLGLCSGVWDGLGIQRLGEFICWVITILGFGVKGWLKLGRYCVGLRVLTSFCLRLYKLEASCSYRSAARNSVEMSRGGRSVTH